MDFKLKVLEGKNAGQEIAVHGKKFFIGRAEDCHLRPGSDLISRHHCVLLIEDGYIGVRDFGSKNGTYVNQERVVGERELKAGDQLTIGPLQFEVHLAHGLAGKKLPPVVDLKEAATRTAQNAAKDPVDVGQWLAAEAGPTATITQAPTVNGQNGQVHKAPAPHMPAPAQRTPAPQVAAASSASMTETDAIHLSNTQTMTPEMAGEADTSKTVHGKKPVGKLPQLPNASKDSQEAAAAMLNKLRKRR